MNISESSTPNRIIFRAGALLCIILCLSCVAQAQWAPTSTGSNDIHNTNSGNVGIGPITPSEKLAVSGNIQYSVADGSVFDFKPVNQFGFGLRLKPNSSAGGVANRSFQIGLWDNANTYTALATVDDSGRVGVGTTSPGQLLQLQSTGATTYLNINNNKASSGGTSAVQFGLNDGNFNTADAARIEARIVSAGPYYSALDFKPYDDVLGATTRMTILGSGNVGIGTTGPNSKLQVNAGNVDGIDIHSANSGYLRLTTDTGGTARNWAIASQYSSDRLEIMRSTTNGGVPLTPMMAFDSSGHVGIGTNPTSAYMLEVEGAIHAIGAITGTTVNATYQDVAEWVATSKDVPVASVVVLDSNHSNQVTTSFKGYDTRVAGVVSARPGLVLGQSGAGKAMIATVGRVKVKVDATRQPIQVGDLLVTGTLEGTAMKSEPVNVGGVEMHRPGTLIGKALEPLERGTGEILVLLSLQ